MAYDVTTQNFTGFVRPYSDLAKFRSFVAQYCYQAFYILHGSDRNEETGELIPIHLHFVVKTRRRMRETTFRNHLADALGVDVISVSNRATRSLRGSVRYLVHKDDPDKFQYSPDSISVYNVLPFELTSILSEKAEISIPYILSLCETNDHLWQVIECIGLDEYKKWHQVIKDIFYSVHR